MDYQDINAQTIDGWVKDGWEWGKSTDHETYAAALGGDWNVHLSPTKNVPHEWFGELKGKKVLGLACGGGQQMPIFCACGAECTVLDYSDEQLESERKVAKREGYDIRVIKADMTKPLPFGDETFDIVFHPVANCYARKLEPIWRECYRVLKKGGIFIAGMDNGINFLFADDEETVVANHFPFDPITDPGQMEQMVRDNGGVQFSHTAEDNIGDQLKAGFRITDLYEDTNGSGRLHELNIPCFVVTRAVKE